MSALSSILSEMVVALATLAPRDSIVLAFLGY